MSLSKRQFALQDYSEGESQRKRPCKHMDGGDAEHRAEDYVEETVETRVKMSETSATESAKDAG